MRNSNGGNVSTREDTDIKFVKRQEYNDNRYRPLLITGEKGENSDISYRGRSEYYVEKHRLNQKEDVTPTVGSGSSSCGNISLMPNGRMNTITKEERGCSRLPSSIDGRSDSSMSNEQNSQHNIVTSKKKVREVEADRSGSSSNGKHVASKYTMQNGTMATLAKEKEQDTLFRGKSEVSVNLSKLHSGVDGRSDSSASIEHDSQLNIAMSKRKVGEEETERFKSYYNSPPPPPYVKLKDNAIPAPYVKPKASNVEAVISLLNKGNAVVNSHMPQKEEDRPHREGFGHHHEKEPTYQNDIPLPKPRSTRRKQSKSSSTHCNDEKVEDSGTVKRSSSSRRKEHSRKGLQLLFDDEHHQKDEEERMMDKLLLHYSKKPSDFDVGKLRKKSQAHPSNQKDSNGSELRHVRSKDGPDVNHEMVPPPTRSVSLPREQTALSEPTKVYARANSFQPDNMARHVHPKLPDYDDLAAQFAAMRGQ